MCRFIYIYTYSKTLSKTFETLSHEIRNYLVPVYDYIHLLSENQLYFPTDTKQKANLFFPLG